MGANFSDGKVLGVSGLLAALIYIISLFAAAFTTSGFEIGVNNINDLGTSFVYNAGCVVAGILGILFGLGIFIRNKDGVFIARIYSILILVGSIILIVLGATKSEGIVVTIFEVVAIIAVLSELGLNWVSEQKALMIVSAFFAIFMLGTAALDAILGFGFAVFTALWIIITSITYVTEGLAPTQESKKVEKTKKTEVKKQQAPAKTTDKATAKNEIKNDSVKASAVASNVKSEAPKQDKKAEAKTEPKKNEVPETKSVPEKKEEIPKLKVMSSRDAAVVRDNRKTDDVPSDSASKESPKAEPVKELPKVEPAKELPKAEPVKELSKSEPVKELPKAEPVKELPKVEPVKELPKAEPVKELPKVEPAREEAALSAATISKDESNIDEDEVDIESADESGDDDEFNIIEDTPDALVRRAAWNKGLRCRRNYGTHNIPVAFVKGKVAVYISSSPIDEAVAEKLRSNGWVVLHYLESEITDGKVQGEEISKAVKENLKAERASKKKKKSK